MRRALLATLALLAVPAFALAPGDYRNFYTPSQRQYPTLYGTAYYVENKESHSTSYTLTPDGNGGYSYDIDILGASAVTATKTALEAAILAAEAYAEAKYAQDEVDTFAKTLYQLLAVQGITITDRNGERMTIKFDGAAIGRAMQAAHGGGDMTATTDSEFTDSVPVDNKTVNFTENTGKLQIYGAETAAASTSQWWDDLGFFVPTLKGAGTVAWKKYGGYDANVFTTENAGESSRVLSLIDFYTPANENVCQENLNQLLTEESGTQRDMHYVICRYGAGNSSRIHYLPIGDRLMGAAECDNLSITTNETYKFHIVGVGDAVSGQVLASDGRAGVDWVNPSPVVSYDDQDASFTISPGGNDDSGDTLVYLPYVYIEEEEDGWTFTVRQVNSFDGTEEEPVFIPRASNTVDNVTLDLNEDGQMQIKGYSDELDANQYVGTDNSGTWGIHGLPSSRVDTYSIVTNASQHEGEAALAGFWDNATTDGMFPVKSGDTLTWVSTNAANCAFKVDNYSVVTNADQHEGEAAIAGFWDNETVDGMFPVKSGGTFAWVRTNATEGAFRVDDASITTNSDHGATTDNAASLYGWSDAATGAFPSKTSNSKLEWSNLDARTLTFNTLNGDKVIGLSGWNYNYSGDVPGFLANMGGQLVYLSVPVPIPPDGESIEAVSDGGTTNLQIKGWKDQSECDASLMSMISRSGDINRGTHKILCRVDGSDDSHSLHYLPIGGGVVMEPDGCSIVTNADDHAGEAAIAGFWDEETESGMFPVKSGDTLVWVPTNSVASSFKVDTYSIVTNEPGHEGEAAIAGFWSDSAEGDVLTRSSSGLAWTAPPRVVVDTYSVVTNSTGHEGEIAVSGFWDAEENAMPHKEGGRLVWGGLSAVTNTILAGAGINITDNGGGAITISAEPLAAEDSGGGLPVSLSVVTDVRYDPETHKFQCKRRTVTFIGTLGEEDDWEDVFEAVSHQGEHNGEEDL